MLGRGEFAHLWRTFRGMSLDLFWGLNDFETGQGVGESYLTVDLGASSLGRMGGWSGASVCQRLIEQGS